MIKPPTNSKPESQIYYLDPFEIQDLLQSISNPEHAGSAEDYLTSTKFRVDQPGKNQKCPADGIKGERITRDISLPKKYAPLFKRHGSITAATFLGQLRDALIPHTPKKSPSTPPHVCVEVKTEPNGKVKISAWNPFAGPKK